MLDRFGDRIFDRRIIAHIRRDRKTLAAVLLDKLLFGDQILFFAARDRQSFAPCSANARATPPVIPVPPPVTNATLPCKMSLSNTFSILIVDFSTEGNEPQRRRDADKDKWPQKSMKIANL